MYLLNIVFIIMPKKTLKLELKQINNFTNVNLKQRPKNGCFMVKVNNRRTNIQASFWSLLSYNSDKPKLIQMSSFLLGLLRNCIIYSLS